MKVFFIGNSKMGTTSLNNALREEGYATTKTPRNSYYSHLAECNTSHFDQSNYFLDGNFHNFINLKNWFPNAKFVLLYRDPEDWLISMFNWIYHIDNRHMKDDMFLVKINRMIMNQSVLKSLMITWFLYQKRVINYFKNSDQFLRVNLTSGDMKEWQRLSDFIGIDVKPRQDNQQLVKDLPENFRLIVHDAKRKSESIDLNLEKTPSNNLSNYLFQWSINVLLKDFINERHLVKNIKESIKNKRPLGALIHLKKFMVVISALVIRWFTTPNKIMSPYIY